MNAAGAAKYVGRVGGLAVAFGVGTAVLTGYGVASAETGSAGSESGSASRSASQGSASSSGSVAAASASNETSSAADDSSATDNDVELSDDLDDTALDAADLDETADSADSDDTDSSDAFGAEAEVGDVVDLDELRAPDDDGSEADPTEEAELEADVPESSSVTLVSASATSPDPLTDGGSDVPAGVPVDLMLAAATRRESSVEAQAVPVVAPASEAAQVTSVGLFDNPITVTTIPTELEDGILLGIIEAVSSRGFELSYTVVDDPTDGGKMTLVNSTECQQITSCGDAFPGAPADSGNYTLLPTLSTVQSGGTLEFSVLVSEVTDFDKLMENLLGPTLGPLVVPPVVRSLQQVPIVGALLAPLIGYSVVETISVDVGELVSPGTPVAFTTYVTSFDGVQISTNYFPVSGMAEGDPPAPTILNGPGLGQAGYINPFGPDVPSGAPAVAIPGINLLRTEGYNYVSWDPRGEHASGGVLQLDNPFFEGRDVQAIIDYLVANGLTATEGTTPSGSPDPLIGMTGGSYGGGIQLVVAGIDSRVDAIAPGIAWNSLNEAIYPEDAFKTAWANLLYLDLVSIGADINSQIPTAILTGNLFNFVSESAQAVLASSGPTVLVDRITAPTLYLQGIQDGLFVLEQSIQNAEITDANEIPTKMIWFCGGHGVCLDPVNPFQNDVAVGDTMDWLNRFVMGEATPEPPNFQWFDQSGGHFTSDLFIFDEGFAGTTIDVSDNGGFLPLYSLIGGSGPSSDAPLLVSQATASEARNAINVLITTPPEETLIVGAPEVSFTYSGFGTADFVYGQIVDEETGLVLGNLVTPIPVNLDGGTHTVTADLENIVYTAPSSDQLKLQITSSATVYEAWSAWGGISISDIEVKLPTVAPGVATRVLG